MKRWILPHGLKTSWETISRCCAWSRPSPGAAIGIYKMSTKIAVKPLIERYLQHMRIAKEQARARIRAGARALPGTMARNIAFTDAYANIQESMAEQAVKYRLAASAQTMVEALRPRPLLLADMALTSMVDLADHTRELDPDIETPILHLPDRPIWIELEQPIGTHTGEIAGMFLNSSDREIERQLTLEQKPGVRSILEQAGRQGEDYKWSLHFIDSHGVPRSLYEYHEQERAWSITPGGEPCLTEECKIDREVSDLTGRVYERTIPCQFCNTILAYWRSWFTTALLAVQGEFAEAEDTAWPTEQVTTVRKVQRPAGPKYDDIPVVHDYYLVQFDASVKRSAPAVDQAESQARGSWVSAALEINPEFVVYVRHDFGSVQRHLDPDRNPRWKEKRVVEVKAHARRVPMRVGNLQRRITRVMASTYEKDQNND